MKLMVLVCLRTYVMKTTCELVTRGLSIVVGNVQAELVLVLNNYRLPLHNHLHETRVYSWNTYPTRFFVVTRLTPCILYFRVSMSYHNKVTCARANTTCDFKRGGATKPIIGSS